MIEAIIMLNTWLYFATDVATVHKTPAISLGLALLVGFIAAVGLGSIAWYNSKRPLGWEDKGRPDIVPDIDN
ncbi:hypothetical protein J5X98_11580 [Leptothermofonsia sichuanensis E412]|uniref:photosystem II assembly protein Psb35 n=1 Tax=Leptothermofonsia sichuanensis TaxID=2917832 RepID=UPI001CA6E16E|nr:hypothetical protein J5X98_11580 [Leptothermofonsia sichuanensis E412]